MWPEGFFKTGNVDTATAFYTWHDNYMYVLASNQNKQNRIAQPVFNDRTDGDFNLTKHINYPIVILENRVNFLKIYDWIL
jgi:hypothetical protein